MQATILASYEASANRNRYISHDKYAMYHDLRINMLSNVDSKEVNPVARVAAADTC